MLNEPGPRPDAGNYAVAKVREVAAGESAVMMATNSIIVILIIGLIAGWLAGKIMGGGFGIIGDIIIGIVGAFIGSWLWGVLRLPGIGPWWLTAIVIATVGACILLFIIRLIKR